MNTNISNVSIQWNVSIGLPGKNDLATPDVAFYGDAVGAPGNAIWPGQDRAA